MNNLSVSLFCTPAYIQSLSKQVSRCLSYEYSPFCGISTNAASTDNSDKKANFRSQSSAWPSMGNVQKMFKFLALFGQDKDIFIKSHKTKNDNSILLFCLIVSLDVGIILFCHSFFMDGLSCNVYRISPITGKNTKNCKIILHFSQNFPACLLFYPIGCCSI